MLELKLLHRSRKVDFPPLDKWRDGSRKDGEWAFGRRCRARGKTGGGGRGRLKRRSDMRTIINHQQPPFPMTTPPTFRALRVIHASSVCPPSSTARPDPSEHRETKASPVSHSPRCAGCTATPQAIRATPPLEASFSCLPENPTRTGRTDTIGPERRRTSAPVRDATHPGDPDSAPPWCVTTPTCLAPAPRGLQDKASPP